VGEVVIFTKKKRKRLRPNKREDRGSAELKIFPVLRSEDRFKFHGIVLDVAAGLYSVRRALTEVYGRHYSDGPKHDLTREFSRLGWEIHRRANAIRRACGRPELELPTRSRRQTVPRQPPPPTAA